MEFRLTIVVFICLAVLACALPEPNNVIRERRDVMESMKSAWNEVVKTLSNAGDAVVHVFKPTERSAVDKMADGLKSLTQ